MTRVNAVRILRQVHKLSFDDAMLVTAYARETCAADWNGILVCYYAVTRTYSVS
jgi:hypothetical protein